jgi:GNAT superfamily N-acetyltransferase
MRFVLGTEPKGYTDNLKGLLGFFVTARALHGEPLLGIRDGANLNAAALVSRPARRVAPAALDELRERVRAELGASARARYEAFGAACAPFQADVPHIHLNMIGVRPSAQGKGLGRTLIEPVHLLSWNDTESGGLSLSTEDARNVPLYEHLGYRPAGHATVAPRLETWGFSRPD